MGGVFSSNTALDDRVERALEIRRLKEEIASLKQDNNELRHEMMREINKDLAKFGGEPDNIRKPSEISALVVDKLVEAHLADPDTNLGAVPDFIERPAMRAMFLYMLKTMAHGVDTMKLEFFGHEIITHMRPVRKECPELDEGEADEGLPQYDSYGEDDYRGGISEEGDAVSAHAIPL